MVCKSDRLFEPVSGPAALRTERRWSGASPSVIGDWVATKEKPKHYWATQEARCRNGFGVHGRPHQQAKRCPWLWRGFAC